MPARAPAPVGARRIRATLLSLLVVATALAAAAGVRSLAPPADSEAASSRSAAGRTRIEPTAPDPPPASASSAAMPAPARSSAPQPSVDPPPLGATSADGVVADGTTVEDGDHPAVAGLDPALLGALRAAADDAGFPFVITSGWRSAAYQAQLLRDAVAQHGSEAEAARWVATPETSAHVSGDAVDLGGEAAAWLARNGAAYGLCPIYDNEPWHYELRPDAAAIGCPATYPDPTFDPRMQK